MGAKLDITGQKFGRLTALYEVERIGRLRRWHCTCECGKEVEVYQCHLTTGATKSCGCYRRDVPPKKREPKLIKPKRKPKCPYPSYSCNKSRKGLCCSECEENATCQNACLNTPEKCGYKKAVKIHAELEEYK